MKRHPSLVPLSRDHHGALILARLIQKNAPAYIGLTANTEGKAEYALNFYNEKLVKHFEDEEKILELVTGLNSALDLMVSTILREHRELHVLFKSISGHGDITTHLDELGKALELHVRREERELFPMIEKTCGERLMTAINTSLSAHS